MRRGPEAAVKTLATLAVLTLTSLAGSPTGARAEATVDLDIDFVGDGSPDFTASEVHESFATAMLAESSRVPNSPEGEERIADAEGTARAASLELHCECGLSETPLSRCVSTMARDDFVVVGDIGPPVVIQYSMRLIADLGSGYLGDSPSAFGYHTVFFRLDPVGPGSRVEYSGVRDVGGRSADVTIDVGQVDILDATTHRFEAVVRRSRSVARNTPFSFEAELRTTCQSSFSPAFDADMSMHADVRNFTYELPPGLTLVPEPGACAGLAAIATLLGVARARASG
jgi:hypothetical protein